MSPGACRSKRSRSAIRACFPHCENTGTSASRWCTRASTDRWCSALTGRDIWRTNQVDGEDPLGRFSRNAAAHLRRADTFLHAPDILVNSFYDPALEQGCAFEELISFHGGLGGPQSRPFILHPVELPILARQIVGAAGVHDLALGWRRALQGGPAPRAPVTSRLRTAPARPT